jgi:outer membrane protein assembly factor BamA
VGIYHHISLRQFPLTTLILIIVFGFLPSHLFSQQIADSVVIVKSISFEGNKLTKDRIIRRELMFSEGDTLSRKELDEKIAKSRENLMNTLLFNFVEPSIKPYQGNNAEAHVLFSFTERWYIWPWPIIEFADQNFNTWWQENRDLSRMSYGVVLKWSNFRGRKESLDFTARLGYHEVFGFDYSVPYLNRKETLGLGTGGFFGRTKEVPVINRDDRQQYYKDDTYVMEAVSAYLSLFYRKHIYNTHTFLISYDLKNFKDTLIVINPSFSVGGKTRLQYIGLSYKYKSDHRDFKAYPLLGHYFDLELTKKGIGLLENGGLNAFFVLSTFRKFFQLNERFYYAFGLNAKFSVDGNQPYYMQRAVGWGRNIVRGYEYYVVNGYNFGIFKSNLKFALLPERQFDIGFLKSEKFRRVHYAFYLNAFLDMGFVDNFYPDPDLNNQLENTLLIGYGLGIDFVTYYDLVFRFEYAINKSLEKGFYLHFTAPI